MTQIDVSLALWKTGFGLTILTIGLVFGMAPLFLRKVSHHWRDRILSIANCFAAGIFSATGFVHLLAEGAELLSDQDMVDGLSATTLSLLLCCLGFFLTFVVDKVLFLSDDGDGHFHHHHHHGDEKKALADPKEGLTDSVIDENAYGTFGVDIEVTKQHSHSHSHDHEHTHKEHHDHHHHHHHHQDDDDSDGKEKSKKEHKPTVSNYILVVVLSLHSVLAGFVLGMSASLDFAAPIFLALISHHWIESFALGVSLLRSNCTSKSIIQLVVLFSVMAPLGILFGMLLRLAISESAADAVEAIFVSIAAGSFIYVALVDILLEEFHTARDKYKKTIALFVGFTLNSTVILVFENLAHNQAEHDH